MWGERRNSTSRRNRKYGEGRINKRGDGRGGIKWKGIGRKRKEGNEGKCWVENYGGCKKKEKIEKNERRE